MNGHIFGPAREVVPKILHELELFGWAQVKDRWLARIHRVPTANCVKSGAVGLSNSQSPASATLPQDVLAKLWPLPETEPCAADAHAVQKRPHRPTRNESRR